jgi:hypothetical protein
MDPMMGERDSQAPLWNYWVNLDKRARGDHPLRRINAVLDLSFVGQAVAYTCGRRGNKSVPPESHPSHDAVLFLDDIESERELMVSNEPGGEESGSRPSKICSSPQCRTYENR